MSVTAIKTDVLILTSDPVQLAKLQRKLKDYEQRYAYLPPEVEPAGTYRYRLLEKLLKERLVDLAEFESYYKQFIWHRPVMFREAVDIIRSYNTGDLSKILAGTGTGLK